MIMKKSSYIARALVASAAAVSLVALAGCASGSSGDNGGSDEGGADTIRIVTSVSNSVPYIVLQAADKIGVFDDTDLNVELVQGTTPTIGQILAGGQADVALADGPTLYATIAQGLPATIVAANDLEWDTRFIVGANSDVQSVEDLKGANFGITGRGGPGDYSIAKLANELGWTEEDYEATTLKDLPSIMAALDSGAIDAFPWGSDVGIKMETAGTGRILAKASDYVGPNVFHGYSASNEYIENHSDALKEFFEVYFAAVERVQDDKELLVGIMVDDWDIDPEAAEAIFDEGAFQRISTDGVIGEENLKGMADAAAFALEDESVKDGEAPYTYWKDL